MNTTHRTHTPGPWNIWPTVDKNNENVECNLIIGPQAGGVAVADVVAVTAHGIVTQDSYETARANARLIAAAPMMLQALKVLTADMEAGYRDQNGDVDHDGIEQAKAAIAQAEGRD